MSDNIQLESKVQILKTLSSIKYVRMKLDGLQWYLDWVLREGYELKDIDPRTCDEMRSWAKELMDAADGLEARLNG